MGRGKYSPSLFMNSIITVYSLWHEILIFLEKPMMYKIHVPFAELLCRLIKLNQDRQKQYSFYSTSCSQKDISKACGELSVQSASNLRQLKWLLSDYKQYTDNCPPFTISPALWNELHSTREHIDIHFIAGIINKIEVQFEVLYKMVCSMLTCTDNSPEAIIHKQYQQLLLTRTLIPHLFIHRN